MILALVGYRATGKTTVARLLAEQLGVPWLDSDAEIERQAGMTIAEIFAQYGEPTFRDYEERVICDLCESEEDLVLATGGGAVMREKTRDALRKAGLVLWLTATPETVLARMQSDSRNAETRPSLTNLPPLEEIRTLMASREECYRATATLEITTELCGPEEIVRQIMTAGGFGSFDGDVQTVQ